jgi:hypothetical protein
MKRIYSILCIFVFSFLLFRIYSIEKKHKETSKKKKGKIAPTTASKGGRLKETAVSTGGSCLPAYRHPNRCCHHCCNPIAS